ncbi:hypothetical protein LO762_26175 [Actinocorallia sp. API 0066]|uniref:hypothetical protein n=1 Tax=Actinocorallia sp. API 0066 TaxID=2896846 RepID=UPI001E5C223A|nr:hypothetical protein [Actinocorallia sp. API 0066]MCD0452643.1 hypothetical protein [Actinocorallia sp. API 0066]
MAAETLEFQVESHQLLQLMIHSNKDVSPREPISNASDALDEPRIAHLRGDAPGAVLADPHITLIVDSPARTLTVGDSGIVENEVVAPIGTIADSGTRGLSQGSAGRRGPGAPESACCPNWWIMSTLVNCAWPRRRADIGRGRPIRPGFRRQPDGSPLRGNKTPGQK